MCFLGGSTGKGYQKLTDTIVSEIHSSFSEKENLFMGNRLPLKSIVLAGWSYLNNQKDFEFNFGVNGCAGARNGVSAQMNANWRF